MGSSDCCHQASNWMDSSRSWFSGRFFGLPCLLGRGVNDIFGYIGGAFSLIGCLLGNFLSILEFRSIQGDIIYLEVFGMIDYFKIFKVMIYTFQPMDLLFYGLAIYWGYKFSLRNLSGEQISQLENQARYVGRLPNRSDISFCNSTFLEEECNLPRSSDINNESFKS